MLPFALGNVFLTGAVVLADPSLESLARVGLLALLGLGGLTAAAARTAAPPHGAEGHAHAAPASGH
jgi:NADH-quinone oxidoreductase subunit H